MPKLRPEVACAMVGFTLGMCMSMGVTETVDTGVFLVAKAAGGVAWTANWFVEPKYTGQEDLPPGFRGETPSLEVRQKDGSTPSQCQTVDPSALVCSTVRTAGFSMWQEEGTHMVFVRRAFDEIQGRAPFVSENGKYLAFWCEHTASWRLTRMEDEQLARDGSCMALAASSDGVQFKDSAGWMESRADPLNYEAAWPSEDNERIAKVDYGFEISLGDTSDEGSWAGAADIMCR